MEERIRQSAGGARRRVKAVDDGGREVKRWW